MPRFAGKALLTLLTVKRSRSGRPNWDRILILSSFAVTIGLVVLYTYGKTTSRW